MQKLQNLLLAVFGILCLLPLTSCGNDDDLKNGGLNGPYNDFVNLESYSGHVARFVAQPAGTDIDVVLSADLGADTLDTKTFPIGSRLYLSYYINTADVSLDPSVTNIRLNTVARAIAPKQVDVPSDSCTLGDRVMQFVTRPYRSGHYINIVVIAPADTTRTFTCQVDESTLSSATPSLYLSTSGTAPQQSRVIYPISVDISRFWNSSAFTGIIFNVGGTNIQNETRFTFSK